MFETLLAKPDPQQVGTPASIARERAFADALIKSGIDYSPIQSWTQGAARVAQAMLGGFEDRRANQLEQAGIRNDQANLGALAGSMFGGGGSSAGPPITGAAPSAAVTTGSLASDGSAVPTNGNPGPVTPVALPAGDLSKQAYDYFTTKGYTPAAAAGLVGNMAQESGFAPDVLSGQRMGDKGTSGYLGQWHADRLTNFQNFAAQQGKSPSDFQTQLDFYNHELDTSEGRTKELLQGVTDPVKAAAIATGYERPYGWKLGGDPTRISGWANRAGYAQHAFNQWGQGAAPAVAATPSPPAGVQVASNNPTFAPQMPPAALGYQQGNDPTIFASGLPNPTPFSGPGAVPISGGAPPVPPSPAASPAPALGPNGLPTATNLGLRRQGIDPLQFMSGYQPLPAETGSVPQTVPAGPSPTVVPSIAPAAPSMAPVAPPAAIPPQAAVAALQGAPQGAKDSIVQSMIARGINPTNGQPLPNPGIGRVAQAMMAGGPPQTAAVAPSPAVSPAVAQVAQAMAPPQAVAGGPVAASAPFASGPQGAPQPVTGGPQADILSPQGGQAQVQAAVRALANPYASAATKQVAEMIMTREMQAQDPLRRLQALEIQQKMAGGTPQEQEVRALEIQKTKQELAGGTPVQQETAQVGLEQAKQNLIPKQEFQILNGRMVSLNPRSGTAADVTPPGMQPGFRPATPEERQAYGIAPGIPLSIGPDGKPMALGPDTVVNNQSGETAFEQATGKAQADMFGTMATDGLAAKTDLGNIINLRANIQNLPGGLLGKAQQIANSWGIKLGDNASSVEYADALLNKLTPSQRQGMPGAASNRDVQMFREALPQLSNTPEGNAMILDTMQALAEQRMAQGQISMKALTGQIPRQQAFAMLQNLPDPFAKMREAFGGKGVLPPQSGVQGAAPAAPVVPQAAPAAPAAAPQAPAGQPPMQGARQAPNGKWYLKNPAYGTDPSATQWLEVQP